MRGTFTKTTLNRRGFVLRAVGAVGGSVLWAVRPVPVAAGAADPATLDQKPANLTADSSLRIGGLTEVRLV